MQCHERRYQSGALYARISDEKREYFYEDGTLKTIEMYQNGQFHGEILLYWPNGKLKRKCHFQKGVRSGLDQIWDETGKLVDEKEFNNV